MPPPLHSHVVTTLVVYCFVVWFYRHRTFERFDSELNEITNITELRTFEKTVNEAMRKRKLQSHHGVILRNTIETKEDEIDNSWFTKFSKDSEE